MTTTEITAGSTKQSRCDVVYENTAQLNGPFFATEQTWLATLDLNGHVAWSVKSGAERCSAA
jgi:hypothetical protein